MIRVIGDVHGNLTGLTELLNKKLPRESERYIIYYLGDLVGKGPNSLAVMELVNKQVKNGQAKVILGNYEKALYAFYCGKFYSPRYQAALKQIQDEVTLAGSKGKLILNEFINVIENAHPWLVEGNNIFVHAIWDDKFLEYGEAPKYKDLTSQQARNYFGYACTGHKNYDENKTFEYSKVDWSWLDKLSKEKRVYVGHISMPHITQKIGANEAILHLIDTGSGKKDDGYLSCLLID